MNNDGSIASEVVTKSIFFGLSAAGYYAESAREKEMFLLESKLMDNLGLC